MVRTCEPSENRSRLLASEVAACFYCFAEFDPATITEWIGGEVEEVPGQTALCPFCTVDAVVGFNGGVDAAWLKAAHQRGFG